MSPAPLTTNMGNAPIDPTIESQGTSFSDKVAFAALILSAGAFVMVCLQVIYEYSASNLRDKCSTGAIGGWHRYMKTGWDVRSWSLRIMYPQVNLGIKEVLKVKRKATR